MFITSRRDSLFLYSFFVSVAYILLISSFVSAYVYEIQAQSLSIWVSDFSITYNDSDPEDGMLTINEIIHFSGVNYHDSNTGFYGTYEQVAGTPQLELIFSELYIVNSHPTAIIPWVFYDYDNEFTPSGEHWINLGPGGWTYNTVNLGRPRIVDFDIDFDVDGSDLIAYIFDPSGISLEELATNFGISE